MLYTSDATVVCIVKLSFETGFLSFEKIGHSDVTITKLSENRDHETIFFGMCLFFLSSEAQLMACLDVHNQSKYFGMRRILSQKNKKKQTY